MAEEKNFEDRVKRFLKEHHCWYVKYWGGGSFTKAGIPDLLVCCNGYFMGVELKSSRGKATDLQKASLKKITHANGIGIVLHPADFDQFKDFVMCIQQGEYPADLYVSKKYPFLFNWW